MLLHEEVGRDRDELLADARRPILASAVLRGRAVNVSGFNICARDAALSISWPQGDARRNATAVLVACSEVRLPGSAARQAAWAALPFDADELLDEGGWVGIRARASGLRSIGEFAVDFGAAL